MTLRELLKKNDKLDVRTVELANDNEAYSVTGPYLAIVAATSDAIAANLLDPDRIVRMGISKNGQKLHLVALKMAMVELDETTAEKQTQIATQSDFVYGHAIVAMDKNITCAVLDRGFNHAKQAKALNSIHRALFQNDLVSGSNFNALLLLGRASQKRVIVAFQKGKADLSVQITPPFPNAETRYGFVGREGIAAVKVGTGNLATLTADQIGRLLNNSNEKSTNDIDWHYQQFDFRFEEVTPSVEASVPTVVVTYCNSKGARQVALFHGVSKLAATGVWRMHLFIDPKHTMAIGKNAPAITRLTQERVVTVGIGDHNPRLQTTGFGGYAPTSIDMLSKLANAASGPAFQQAKHFAIAS
ncbi:hypothetical protein FJZ23_00830 [Candidatus Parcubacteria bacterium]|nr:hypothetical protein [Candidatus Parcubacteria bacterium]